MDKLPPEAIAALQRGSLIEAIKIVRDKTGLDLKSSKEAVERYANGEGTPADWQEGDWGRGEPEGAGMQGNGPAAVPSAALTALAKGNKIEAVRLTREATGLGPGRGQATGREPPEPGGRRFRALAVGHSDEPDGRAGAGAARGLKWLPIVIVLLVVALAWLYFAKGA
jgi:hypothetical protein